MTADRLTLETDFGTIEIELHSDAAPATVAYVAGMVGAGVYNGARFYRSATLGRENRQPLIQGGPLASRVLGETVHTSGVHMLDTVESTEQTGLAHTRGTVSLARDLGASNRVLPELFICLDDYPDLDAGGRDEPDTQGFPAFGTVVNGIDVVTQIAAMPTDGESTSPILAGQVLTTPVTILTATIS